MRLKHFLLGGAIVGIMCSCSDDIDRAEDGKIMENETTTYVRLSIIGKGATTRAEEYKYEYGSTDENDVEEILLAFYDAGRNYVGTTRYTVKDAKEVLGNPGHPLGGTVERKLTVVVPVTLPENINYPKYVVAYVNPTSKSGDLGTDKLEDAMGKIRERAEISPNGARTMNNSVYFNAETGYARFATEVDFHTNFFETMEEAENADKATIEITVERMEAKVRLSTPLAEINPAAFETTSGIETDTKYTLEFVPEAWFVNGTEKRSFLLKNFRSNRVNFTSGNYTDTDFGMSLNLLKEAFKNTSDTRDEQINDPANLRSYWAIDPTYFYDVNNADELYPNVSYDVKYNEGLVNPKAKEYPLRYRSYKKVTEEWAGHTSTNYVKFDGNVKTHEYVPENTMSSNTLKSTDAMASMTSVVLVGRYVVKNAAGTMVFDGNTTNIDSSFYVRHETENKKLVMLSDKEAKEFFIERGGSTLFVQSRDKDGNVIENAFEPLRAAHLRSGLYPVNHNYFEILYPNENRTGSIHPSEQWRTLTVKTEHYKDLYMYDASADNGNGGYKQLSVANESEISDLKLRMYSSYGVIEKFQTGKAYFNVPLKHIWGAGSSSNKFNASNVLLGDYGVVRNHVYDLTINKIEGLGTGIGNINQPIVPPTDNESYYISTRLNILQWLLVSQSVDL